MKPVYIKMMNFGSYRNETIDFNGIDHGIFLITGDTGAGKTTIFDAITYALYDESSGGKRSERMMISQYSDIGGRTEVEYCFSIGRDVYKIIRSPEQTRYKKKVSDSGEVVYEPLKTPDKPSVTLILPDGSTFSGRKKDTDEKIRGIIGIDCQQFTHIAMLAQGDFLKLLHAESKKRKEIFARIFDTEIYYMIEVELRTRYNALKRELEDNEREIKSRLEDVKCMPGSEYEEEWKEKGSFSELGGEDIIELISLINKELSDCHGNLERQIEEIKEQEKELQIKIDEAGKVNKYFDEYDSAVMESKKLEEKAEDTERSEKKLKRADKARNVAGAYSLYMSRKEEYAKKTEAVDELKRQAVQKKKELGKLIDKRDKANERYEAEHAAMVKEQNMLEAELPGYDELESVRQSYDEAVKKLKEAEDKKKAAKEYAEKIEKKKEEAGRIEEEYNTRTAHHEKIYHDFISNYAVIMRGQLVDGMPCPVCGSTHHVTAASEKTSTVTQKDVDRAKKEMDALGKQYGRIKEELADMTSKQADKKNDADKEFERWSVTKEEKQKQLEKVKKGLTCSDREEAKKRIKNIAECIELLEKEKNEADKEYQTAVNEINNLEGRRSTEEQNCAELEQQVNNNLNELEILYISNGFESIEDYRLAELDAHAMEKLNSEIEEYKKRVMENKYRVEHLAEKINGMERIDITEYEAKKKKFIENRGQLQEKRDILYRILTTNNSSKNHITGNYKLREELEKKEVVLKSLYNTANGKLSRKGINFQTYVQRKYFKQVIAAANERLVRLSGGQFILRCRAIEDLGTQGEVGLDLDVYSIINDSLRDVKTLSGGESFQAALAMALGLSDIIQNAAGKIRIDTMFIDEGFGSLSDDTRNQALELLNDLTCGSRLIGVISHVTELKAQVETKLVVTKNEKGSSAVWRN